MSKLKTSIERGFQKSSAKVVAIIFLQLGLIFLGWQHVVLDQPPLAFASRGTNYYFDQLLSSQIDTHTGKKILYNQLSTSPGEMYRLWLELRATTMRDDDTLAGCAVNITAITQVTGNEKKIGNFVFQNEELHSLSFIFQSEDYYSDLAYSLTDKSCHAQVSIGSIKLVKLTDAPTKDISQRGLLTLPLTSAHQEASDGASFSVGGRKRVGQVFQATNNYLSAVDFRIRTSGNGGVGSYSIELHEVERVDDSWNVLEKVNAGFNFNLSDSDKYMVKENDVSTWHLPLAAPLIPNHYYFLGINDALSESTLFNHIFLEGTHALSSYDQGRAVEIRNGKTRNLPGQLFFRVYGAVVASQNSGSLLTNATIDDLGNGRGRYSYGSNGLFSDIFDLDPNSILSLGKSQAVFFDTTRRAIVGLAFDDAHFSYKIDTRYPFSSMRFILNAMATDTLRILVDYSFDGNTWERVLENDESNIQEQIIIGDKKKSQVYIRVGYQNTNNQKEDKLLPRLFGVKSLTVNADLDL